MKNYFLLLFCTCNIRKHAQQSKTFIQVKSFQHKQAIRFEHNLQRNHKMNINGDRHFYLLDNDNIFKNHKSLQ